jgi:5-methylthioadenosine/S-adenosylhomocysteine deaminase
MPGLVNTHMHSGLLRGTAEGLPVWEWLQQFIDPMHRVVNEREAEIASYLCYAEALLSGTTTIVDMWRHMHGRRRRRRSLAFAVLVPSVAEHPDHDYFETLNTNEALIKQWHGGADGRVHVWMGLEHMFYATPEAYKRAMDISKQYQVGFHTHSNESQFDVEETLRRHNMRPVEALEKFGLLEAPHTLLAHCVWLSDHEIEILAHQVGVAHTGQQYEAASGRRGGRPVSSRYCGGTGHRWREGERNNLDLFEEMKTASFLRSYPDSTPPRSMRGQSVAWDDQRCRAWD